MSESCKVFLKISQQFILSIQWRSESREFGMDISSSVYGIFHEISFDQN